MKQPKYVNKNEKAPNRVLISVVIALAVILVALLVLGILGGRSNETPMASEASTAGSDEPAATDEVADPKDTENVSQEDETAENTTAPQETEEETAAPAVADHIISTPYGDLRFPSEWKPFLKTEIPKEDPYTVTFFCVLDGRGQTLKLYTITFDGNIANASAALKTAEGYVPVEVSQETFTPDDSWTDSDINIVYTMRDTLNYVMKGLPLEDVPESTGSAGDLPESMKADMAVDTPYMELHYPSKWADNLSIKTENGSAYCVSYYAKIGDHDETLLFTVCFGGEKGTLLKTIKAENGEMVEIRIDVSELDLDSTWLDEEHKMIYGMQEDLNYLLDKMN